MEKSAVFLYGYDILVFCSAFTSLLCLQASCCLYSKEARSQYRKKRCSVILCLVFCVCVLLFLYGILCRRGIIRNTSEILWNE